MAMPIEASEVAVGDWSPTYGTITEVNRQYVEGALVGVNIRFFLGYRLTNVKPDLQLLIEQGGADIIHNGMPDSSQVRSGLKDDHADD